MKEKKTLLIVALALVLLMGGAYVLYGQLSRGAEHNQLGGNTQPPESAAPSGEGTQAPEPQPAPDFTVYDGDGSTVNLSDFRGKPVVLNFWASWCGPCRKELPDFDAASQELAGEVQFLMVNMTGGRETKEQAGALIRQEGYSFPVY